jgi:signal transduction histidine kinase
MRLSMDQEKLSLLYVEDEPETRELVASALASEYPDIVLYVASDGAEGLELYRTHRPEVVVTDIKMPLMDGLAMAGEIKSLNPEVEIIALTAYSDTSFLVEAIDIGFSQYVLKPTDLGKLISAIDRRIETVRMKQQVREQGERLRKVVTELEAANRELEAFSYTVAHDLRKPLTVINGYCEMLLDLCGGALDEECREFVQKAYDGTWRMNRLIDALLLFSQAAHVEPQRERVNLSAIAEEVAEELKLAEPDRNVRFTVAADLWVKGDPSLLRGVMSNLLGNAWKYISEKQGEIEVGSLIIDGQQTFFIRDNGIGFDSSEAGEIFMPFRRLPEGQGIGGLGIGLATVQRIISRHGGRVWAEGELGKGATFYFTLE